MNGFDFRGTVWFRGETENYLNCYNSRNICHSEERLSVLESPSYALLDDIFGRLKLENFYNPFFWRHQIWRHNMIFWHRFSLQMIKTPIQGSAQSFVRKSSKSGNLPLMTHFGALWPQCVNLSYSSLLSPSYGLYLFKCHLMPKNNNPRRYQPLDNTS